MNRRIRFCSLLAMAAVGLAGCVAKIGPGGAAPGLIRSDVTYPNLLNPNMEYRIVFDRDDVEILGPVEVESSSKWFFFIWSTGDSGYASLMKQARDLGGDAVMNVTVDTNYKSILILYAKATTRLTGIAYRYRRHGDHPHEYAPTPSPPPNDGEDAADGETPGD